MQSAACILIARTATVSLLFQNLTLSTLIFMISERNECFSFTYAVKPPTMRLEFITLAPQSKSRVSNSRHVSLCYAARGHICKLYVHVSVSTLEMLHISLCMRFGANCHDCDTFGLRSGSQWWLRLVAKRMLGTPCVKEWIVRAWTAVHWPMWTGGTSGFSFIRYRRAAIHCQNLHKRNRYFWFMWLTNCAHWVLMGRPKGKRPLLNASINVQ